MNGDKKMDEYDDPYSFLALGVISKYDTREIERILDEDDFIYRLIIKEIRGIDFSGPFSNCITDDILQNKKRMELMHELDKLSTYFFSKLDISRLRNKILEYIDKYDIIKL